MRVFLCWLCLSGLLVPSNPLREQGLRACGAMGRSAVAGRVLRPGRTRKPPKVAAGTGVRLKPVQCGPAVCIRGGYMTKPCVLDTVEVDGRAFVKISKKEAWLCLSASGKGERTKPLSRTRLVDVLEKEVLSRSRGPNPDNGALLDFDLDEIPVDATSTSKRSKTSSGRRQLSTRSGRGRRGPGRALAGRIAAPVIEVSVGDPSSPSQQLVFHCLAGPPPGRSGSSPWLLVDDVTKLVQALIGEVETGGVTFIPNASQTPKPFWSERDNCWICRAYLPNGAARRKSMSVSRFADEGDPSMMDEPVKRRPLSPSEWQSAKQRVLQEITQWQDRAHDGFSDSGEEE